MANASIGGLVSGLDTATIISQLIQLEARPQSMLKTRVSAQERQVSALQTLNAKIAGIATKAGELANLANWSPVKTTSDNENVTATADSTAHATSLTFDVTKTATASRAFYSTAMAADAQATTSTSLTVSFTDAAKTDVVLNLTDTSLKGVAEAINDPANKTGLRATLVRAGGTDDAPTYQLHVASATTGAGTGFAIDDGSGTFLGGTTATTGTDAELLVNGATITSSSNTITDLMPGVDVTLAAGATGATTITISKDTANLSDKVKGLVDAANMALKEIDGLTASGADAKERGMLAGDATLRTVRNQLLDSVTRGIGGQSLASYGVSVDRSGQLVFDDAKFTAAYEADPTGAAAMFAGTTTWQDAATGADTGAVTLNGATWRTVPGSYYVDSTARTIGGSAATGTGSILTGDAGTPVEGLSLNVSAGATGTVTYRQGFAAALEGITQRISNSTDGLITTTIQGRNTAIDRMEDDIADWDVRLDQRRTALERQYGALEVALGKLQNQASWLAGQISSLPSWSSGS